MAEKLARYGLVNRLSALLNDATTYPLEGANNRLWREYYYARLAQLLCQLGDAEKVYQAITENEQAELKLRAYAFCDWGDLLTRYERLGHPGGIERGTLILGRSLGFGLLDSHLIENYFWLARVARYQARWDKQLEHLVKARTFFEKQGNLYGLAYVYSEMKRADARRGIWKDYFIAHNNAIAALSKIPIEPKVLKATVLCRWVWAQALAGTLELSEQTANEGLAITTELRDDLFTLEILRDLGWAKGNQGKFAEADKCFRESLAIAQRMGETVQQHTTLGFWGFVLGRRGSFQEAMNYLTKSLSVKESLGHIPGILEPLNWLGLVSEIQCKWADAAVFYHRCMQLKWYGRFYFDCAALTGLVRVKHAQEDYGSIPSLLAEAEQLAQQYEYNDHLASLRLTQGMTTDKIQWDAHTTSLNYFKHAMNYALRYNRFLLDEVLGGRPQGTPLRPIIPYCLERGEEGRQMLIALRDWWKIGVNDIGTPRPDTISPIPEGISLLEAERVAREREPGDSSLQRTVIEQIENAMSN